MKNIFFSYDDIGESMLKYKLGTLLLLMVGIFSFNFVSAQTNELPLLGKIIYIDPGHGGSDPGATYKDIKESDLNLSISQKLEAKLVEMGAIVYLTRYGDYDLSVNHTINRKRSDLSRRGNIINRSDCDLFISIHMNAEETGIWRGSEVYYDDINEENETIAKIMQEQLKKYLGSKRSIKKTSELYLQKRIERPGVLVEAGFLSNSSDRYLLKQESYQNKIASALAEGVLVYMEQKTSQ